MIQLANSNENFILQSINKKESRKQKNSNMNQAENEKSKEESRTKTILFRQKLDFKIKSRRANQQLHLFDLWKCGEQSSRNYLFSTCGQRKIIDCWRVLFATIFDKNENACPVQPHADCQYSKNQLLQCLINELEVVCPQNFQQDLQSCGKHEEEQTSKLVMCDFKGSIRDMNDHLSSFCSVLSSCWFKEFGHNQLSPHFTLQDHLIDKMKYNYDLAIQNVKSLKQHQVGPKNNRDIQIQIEILQMQLQANELNQNAQNAVMKKKEKRGITSATILQKRIKSKSDEKISSKEKISLEKANDWRKIQDMKNDNDKKESNQNWQVSTPKIKQICILDLDLSRSARCKRTLTGHSHVVYSMDYFTFGDEQLLASGSRDMKIFVWNVKNGKLVQEFNDNLGIVYGVKFSPYHYYKYRQC
ncbi:WD-40 repeat protein, partial [Reticulomyxa filosa]